MSFVVKALSCRLQRIWPRCVSGSLLPRVRAGRRPEDIALMAVSKTFPPERIREAYDAGLRLFGENRVQEFAGKIDLTFGICTTPNGT